MPANSTIDCGRHHQTRRYKRRRTKVHELVYQRSVQAARPDYAVMHHSASDLLLAELGYLVPYAISPILGCQPGSGFSMAANRTTSQATAAAKLPMHAGGESPEARSAPAARIQAAPAVHAGHTYLHLVFTLSC
jgi:hypothetical protein